MASAVAALGQLLERGVYPAPYLVKGQPALIAVDSKGDARRHVILTPGMDAEHEATALRTLLNNIDPVRAESRAILGRHLALVKPTAEAFARRSVVSGDRPRPIVMSSGRDPYDI